MHDRQQPARIGTCFACMDGLFKPNICACSDEEDEVWGARRPLLARASLPGDASTSQERPHVPAVSPGRREDPWSVRMRDKYGLDTSQFGYDPEGGQPPANLPEGTPPDSSKRCTVM